MSHIVWQANLMIQGRSTKLQQLITFYMVIIVKVSLERIMKFLNNTKLLVQFIDEPESSMGLVLPGAEDDHDVGFRDATFTWLAEQGDGSLTPLSRNFRLHVEGEVLFKCNCINTIVRPGHLH